MRQTREISTDQPRPAPPLEAPAAAHPQQHVSVRRRDAAEAKKAAKSKRKPAHQLSIFESEMLTAWSAW